MDRTTTAQRPFPVSVAGHGLLRMSDGSLMFTPSGADGEQTPRQRVDELHALLGNDEHRARLSAEELALFHLHLVGDDGHGGLWTEALAGQLDGIDPHDTAVLALMRDCIVAVCAEAAARFTAAGESAASIAQMAAEAGISAPAAASAEGQEQGEGGDGSQEASPPGEPNSTGDSPGSDGAQENPPGEGGPGPGQGSESQQAESGEGQQAPDAGAGEQQAEGGEGVQASGAGSAAPVMPTLAELAARQPAARSDRPHVSVHESSDGMIRWLPTGELVTRSRFAELVSEYPTTYTGRLPMGQKVYLGELEVTPADAQRILRQDGPEEIARKLDLAVQGGHDPESWDEHGQPREPLMAAGGWNSPSPIDYTIDTLATTVMPVFDALPSADLDRGSLTWVRQPRLSDIETGGPANADAPVGIWTADMDAAAATDEGVRKTTGTVGPWTPVTVELDAIYKSLREGVLQAKAFPEWIAAWERLTDAAFARTVETYLLDKIEAAFITTAATKGAVVGAARDFITHVALLAVRRRNKERQAPTTPLRCLYPSWVEDLAVIDLMRSGALNNDSSAPQVAARAWVQGQLRALNINGTGYLDSSTLGGQLLDVPAEGANVDELPNTSRVYLFHEGAFVKGVNGSLRVGVIRDQDLVDSNDFRMFEEIFIGLLDRGQWAHTFDLTLAPNGQAAALKDTSAIVGVEGS